MSNVNIRLLKITLTNFKNVQESSIELPSYKNSSKTGSPKYEKCFSNDSDVIGIYGQNGSGKTAFIEALNILKRAMGGETLPDDIKDFVYEDSKFTKLKAVFSVVYEENKYIIEYELKIENIGGKEEEKLIVTEEELKYRIYNGNEWEQLKKILDYEFDENEVLLGKNEYYTKLNNMKDEALVDMKWAKKSSKENKTSFIFSNEMSEDIYYPYVDNNEDFFKDLIEIILLLKRYANINLFVIENARSSIINANIFIPISYRIGDEDSLSKGEKLIKLDGETNIHAKNISKVTKIIDHLNVVLQEIIPDLTVDIKKYPEKTTEKGEEIIPIELKAKRGNLEIPLKGESDGIKKIISILSVMIAMYNNPSVCLAVDELDAGIFEYLLGELLEIIETRASGQLIFTSHNLRPLEKLDKDSLIFTTTNPKNRYIRLSGIKSTNNIRSYYYRFINLGGQDEKLYEETGKNKMATAFYKAGKGD